MRSLALACAVLLACGACSSSGGGQTGGEDFTSGGSAGSGATKTTCERANDKLRECQAQIDAAAATRGYIRPVSISEDCSAGNDECFAKCIAPASCGALVVLSTDKSTDPNEPPIETPDAGTVGDCFATCTQM